MIEPLDVEEPNAARLAEIRRHLARQQAVLDRMDEADELPAELADWMWDCGLLTLALPDRAGTPASIRPLCTVLEELAWHSGGLSLLALAQVTGVTPIVLAGDVEQRERYAHAIRGRRLVAFALSESRAGSDARRLETQIVDRGDHLEVNGVKRFVTLGAQADLIVVFGRNVVDGEERGHSAVVIERGTPGLEVAPKNDLFGMRGAPTTTVFLRHVQVPRSGLLGRPGEGFALAMRTLDRSRPLVGAQAVGLGRAALELSVRYCRKREAFGRSMTQLDGVRMTVADMAVAVDAARLLVRRAADAVDVGAPEATAYAAAAKFFATDAAMRVALDTVQLLGAYGCFRGHRPERIMRDAKLTQIYEGANQVQRLVVGREVLEGASGAAPDPVALARRRRLLARDGAGLAARKRVP